MGAMDVSFSSNIGTGWELASVYDVPLRTPSCDVMDMDDQTLNYITPLK